MMGMCDAAEELIPMLPENQDNATNRGGIALTKAALRLVATKVTCPKPKPGSNANGQHLCPLQELAYGARTFAATRWGAYTFALENVVEIMSPSIDSTPPAETSSQGKTGQYL
jgi:hypothetical protein